MSTSVSIKIEDQSFSAELNDSPAAAMLLEVIPVTVRMYSWGGFKGGVDALKSFGSSIVAELSRESD